MRGFVKEWTDAPTPARVKSAPDTTKRLSKPNTEERRENDYHH